MAPRPPDSKNTKLGAKMPETLHLGAKMAPRPPTWSQDGPKTLNLELGAKMAPRPSTWSQDGPKVQGVAMSPLPVPIGP